MTQTSGEKINYNLRPSKQIQRKMLCEGFRRLSEFAAVSSYRYIGFGSFYFSDFIMFHKELGIANMLSIELDVEHKDRFQFNRPFSCIELTFGHSNEILPKLLWDVRTILWLDCDYNLDSSVLTDIAWFCANAISGSVIVVTVRAKPISLKNPLEHFIQLIGEDRVPPGTTDRVLKGWGTAMVSRKVIHNQILEGLADRNGGRPKGTRFAYKQLFNFHYSDSTKMLTVGGILYDEGTSDKLSACGFDALHFFRSGDDPYKIETPKLTYRELQHLNAQLPVNDYTQLRAEEIPKKDLDSYSKVYRYFPNFAEIDT